MITLEQLIKREAPGHGHHDEAYKMYLQRYWTKYSDIKDLETLESLHIAATQRFKVVGSSHDAVAKCMVLYTIMENLKNG